MQRYFNQCGASRQADERFGEILTATSLSAPNEAVNNEEYSVVLRRAVPFLINTNGKSGQFTHARLSSWQWSLRHAASIYHQTFWTKLNLQIVPRHCTTWEWEWEGLDRGAGSCLTTGRLVQTASFFSSPLSRVQRSLLLSELACRLLTRKT